MHDFWLGKKVFITGHTGFKGGWLSLWLSKLGADVTGYALAPESSPSLFDVARIEDHVTSIIGDIRDFAALEAAISQSNPEIVFHLAAQPLVRRSYDEPKKTFETNVMGTANVMEAIRISQHSCRAIINVTTDKCYQNNQSRWGYSELDQLGGSDPYSYSKSCAEFVASAYKKSFFNKQKIHLVSVRAGNVIGGGDWSSDRLIPDIVDCIFNGKRLLIRNPTAIRPWQHVLEPIFGYMTVAKKIFNEQLSDINDYDAFNFGPEQEESKSVEWIVKRFIEQYGNSASYELRSNHQENSHEEKILVLDNTKAKLLLEWKPKIDLSSAIHRTYEWYKAYHEGVPMKEFTMEQIEEYEKFVF